MRFEGRLKSWKAERGFGFIEPAAGGQEIFLHVSAVPTALRPPQLGQAFTFEATLNRDGKKRATNVGVAEPPARRRPNPGTRRTARAAERPARWSPASALAIPAFVVTYIGVASTWGVPAWVALLYVAMSLACVLVYALDKAAAVAGRWRASEQTLLLLGLAGGWPGALLAQQLLRHKSTKASFRRAFWGTVVLNVGVFIGWHALQRPALWPM